MKKVLSGRKAIDRGLGSHILNAFENLTTAPGLEGFLTRPRIGDGGKLYFGEYESPKLFRLKIGRQPGTGKMSLPIVSLHRKMGHSIEDIMDIYTTLDQKLALDGLIADTFIEGALKLIIMPVILEYQLQCFAQDLDAVDSFCDLVHAHFLNEKYFPVPYQLTVPAETGVHAGRTDVFYVHSEIKNVKELVFEDISPVEDKITGFQLGASVTLRVQSRVFIGENARALDGTLVLFPTKKI